MFDVLLSHAAEAVTQHNNGPPQDTQQSPIRIPQISAPGAAIEGIKSSETIVMGSQTSFRDRGLGTMTGDSSNHTEMGEAQPTRSGDGSKRHSKSSLSC